jgi:non-canonical poly(A) RNA polymerase PAPD5/7
MEDISQGIPALHQEIEDFVEWVSPTEEEKRMRQDVLHSIQSVVQILWPQARVEIIGSYKTELCLPTSDIDLVVFAPFRESVNDTLPLFQLSLLLEEHRLSSPNGVKVITTAKVPIIKFQELKSRCYIDIAFEVNTGIENTKIVQSFLAQYPLLRPLTLVIKYYLKQNNLNDTWSGGIGSYTLVLLIISYLQNFSSSHGLSDGENLADLLIGFFDFYGRRFNYTDNGISVKDKCYYDKKSKMWFNEQFPNSLSVEDPHNPEIDVGSASFEILKAKIAFETAYYRLSECLKFPCLSYLVQSDIIRAQYIAPFRYYIKQIYTFDNLKTNKKNTLLSPKQFSKDKYSRKNSKVSWENQGYYRETNNTPGLPPLLDKNKSHTTVIRYPVPKSRSPNRCLKKLNLQKRKNHSLSGLSVIHN